MTPINLLADVDLTKATLQKLQDTLFDKKGITVEVLRTDLIHPVISGNKWFKLKYHLEEAIKQQQKGMVSIGGAYSNHLLAIACCCYIAGLQSIGIIRGEEPEDYSPTLLQAKQYGMQLHFVSRDQYKNKEKLQSESESRYPGFYWINEGGQSAMGVKGAAEIMDLLTVNNYTHILCAVGTGTMMAGLMNSVKPYQQVCGIPVLKISDHKNNNVLAFITKNSKHSNFSLVYDFHEGGYAKKTESLIQFMNALYIQYQLPTDFVYTAKLFNAVYALTGQSFFPMHSKVLVIHSGGLQGNRSLPNKSLVFHD